MSFQTLTELDTVVQAISSTKHKEVLLKLISKLENKNSTNGFVKSFDYEKISMPASVFSKTEIDKIFSRADSKLLELEKYVAAQENLLKIKR